MAKRNRNTATSTGPGPDNGPTSVTSFHDKLSDAKKQIESFFNSLQDADHFTIECFSNAEGIQVSVSTHGKK